MLKTTQSFYDNSVFKYRNTSYKIHFDVVDLSAKGDIKSITTGNTRYENKADIIDDIAQISRYATGELGQFKLDGSSLLMPPALTSQQMGWWTSLSDGVSRWKTNPRLKVDLHRAHYSVGITLNYDGYSLPVDSICRWYTKGKIISEKNLIYWRFTRSLFDYSKFTAGSFSFTVDDFNYRKPDFEQFFDNPVEGYDSIEIEMIKAYRPQTFCKLYELDFGATYHFTGDDLMGAKIKEKTSTMSNTISPNELTFAIDNSQRRYDVFNPSDFMKYFQQQQKLRVEVAVKNRKTAVYEPISMGTYYLSTFESKRGTVEFKAFGILNNLNNPLFYKSRLYQNEKAGIILSEILEDYPHYIHPNIYDVKLSGYIPVVSIKDALKHVAIATGSVIKEGRDGRVYIYRASEELMDNQLIVENMDYLQSGYAGLISSGVPSVQTSMTPIPYRLTVERDQRIGELTSTQIPYYNRFDVEYLTYANAESEEELFNGELEFDSAGIAIIKHDSPVYDLVFEPSVTYDQYACSTVIRGTKNMKLALLVKGKKRVKTILTASTTLPTKDGEVALSMVLKDCNTLISNSVTAQACAEWYLSQLQKRKDVKFKWWSVATVEASDFINVMTSYDQKIPVQISEITYNLSGLIADVKGVA